MTLSRRRLFSDKGRWKRLSVTLCRPDEQGIGGGVKVVLICTFFNVYPLFGMSDTLMDVNKCKKGYFIIGRSLNGRLSYQKDRH